MLLCNEYIQNLKQTKKMKQKKLLNIYPRMKILVITDILVLQFYGYIGDISADILEKNIDKPKLIKIYKNIRKTS